MDYQNYLDGTKLLLDQSQQEIESYNTIIIDKEFTVFPGVFSPKYFGDTEIFARHLTVNADEKLLEIGPGTGVLSIIAALQGANVLAIDINPIALENTKHNINRFKLDSHVAVRLGNVYTALKPGEQFDAILWNTPFGLIDADAQLTNLERAVFDPGYESTKRFILESPQWLKTNGRLLIGFSTTLGKIELIEQFCDQIGFKLKLIHQKQSTETHPVTFELFEARAR